MEKTIKELLSYELATKRLSQMSFKDNAINYRIAKFKNELSSKLRDYREVLEKINKTLSKEYFVLNEDETVKMEDIKDEKGNIIKKIPVFLEGKTESSLDKDYNERVKELDDQKETISDFSLNLKDLDISVPADVIEPLIEFINQ